MSNWRLTVVSWLQEWQSRLKAVGGLYMGKPAKGGAKPAITQILEYLIKNYGGKEIIPDDINRLPQVVHERTGAAIATINRLIKGEEQHPHQNTLERLASTFKVVIPDIDYTWFQTNRLAAFVEKVRSAGDLVPLRVPHFYESARNLEKWLPGTYISYRYAFLRDKRVAREVLHIEKDLRFSMSTSPRDAGEQIQMFNGVVLPIGPGGRLLYFVGLHSGPISPRGRSLFVHDSHDPAVLRNCKIGILSSTTFQDPISPCAACTVLIRASWLDGEPRRLNQFTRAVTAISSFENLVEGDFGTAHSEIMRGFLDNRPHGTSPEDLVTDPHIVDTILRIDRHRFNERMPSILDEVLNNSNVVAPFKANWREQNPT